MKRRAMPTTKELWDRVNVSMPEAIYMTGYSRQRILTLINNKKITAFREQAGINSEDPEAGNYVLSVRSMHAYFDGRFAEVAEEAGAA